MMTLKEYMKTKRDIFANLDEVRHLMRELFNGELFDNALYAKFSSEKKRMYSTLRDLETNLNGQLDALKVLEGDKNTDYDRMRARYLELETQENRRVTL